MCAHNGEGTGSLSTVPFTLDSYPGPPTITATTRTSITVSWPGYVPAQGAVTAYTITKDSDTPVNVGLALTHTFSALDPGEAFTFQLLAQTPNTVALASLGSQSPWTAAVTAAQVQGITVDDVADTLAAPTATKQTQTR